jgi:hypothetical protein
MALTYQWNDAIEFLKSYARAIPMDKIGVQTCDAVSSEMWGKFPWKDACQTIPPEPLIDSVQDYDSPPSFFKLVSAQIVRTLPQPDWYEPLSISVNLPEMGIPIMPAYIRTVAYQKGLGLLRLANPPVVNVNDAFELHGSYQLTHTRVSSLDQAVWFSDQLWNVVQEGFLYWGYKLQGNWKGADAQFKVFENKMVQAWQQENQGSADVLDPEVNLGAEMQGGW